MEKLIELLNEYEREGGLDLSRYSYTDNEYDLKGKLDKLSELKPFIEWLVQNEKIDFEGRLNTLRFESLVDQTLDSYLALLMILAIQDNSIEFLISILK